MVFNFVVSNLNICNRLTISHICHAHKDEKAGGSEWQKGAMHIVF